MIHEVLAIFVASFLGSWHCAAMCGAFSTMASGESKSYLRLTLYQVARLMSYLALASVAFLFAKPVVYFVNKFEIQWLSSALLICLLAVWLFLLLSKYRIPIGAPRFITTAIRKLRSPNSYYFSILMGLCTALLPCAWLYGFIGLAALKTQYWESAILIAAFWIGTLPSLYLVRIFTLHIDRKLKNYLKPFAVVLLFLLTSYSVYSRTRLQLNENHISPGMSCHSHGLKKGD